MTSTTPIKAALEPCPFCGCTDISNKDNGHEEWFECDWCHATSGYDPAPEFETEPASFHWNRREEHASLGDGVVVPDDLTEQEIRSRAKVIIREAGWKLGSRLSLHSTCELMVRLGVSLSRDPATDRCGHPVCGCDDDAVCAAALATAPAAPSQDRGVRVWPFEYDAPFSAHRYDDDTVSLTAADGRHVAWFNTHTQLPLGRDDLLDEEAAASLKLAEMIAKAMNTALEDPAPAPAAGVEEALTSEWADAYAAFVGAFDTAISRRRSNDEFEADARKRLRDFNDRFLSTLPTAKSVAAPEFDSILDTIDPDFADSFDRSSERVPAPAGEVRGPCIPVTYCGLATSVHVPVGSDEEHCDLCGHPAQPVSAAPAGEAVAWGFFTEDGELICTNTEEMLRKAYPAHRLGPLYRHPAPASDDVARVAEIERLRDALAEIYGKDSHIDASPRGERKVIPGTYARIARAALRDGGQTNG